MYWFRNKCSEHIHFDIKSKAEVHKTGDMKHIRDFPNK